MKIKPRTYYRAFRTEKGERVVSVLAYTPFQARAILRKNNPDAVDNWPVSAEYYNKQNGQTT